MQNVVATLLAVGLWLLALWHVNPSIEVVLWCVFSFLSVCAMGLLLVRYMNANAPDHDLRRWEVGMGVAQTVAGLQFGMVGFLIPKDMTFYAPYITIGLLLIVVGSLSLQVTYRPSIVWVAVPMMVLHSAAMLRVGELLPSLLGLGFVVGVMLLIRLAYLQNTLISRSLHDAEERLVLLSELELRQTEAQQANQAKTRFLAAVSHDLRQPIHSISLLTSALARRADSDLALHRQITASVQTMDDMLDGLLEVSKLDMGHLPLHLAPVYLPALLERLQLQFQAQAQEKALSLTVSTTALWMQSDADELHRLLFNLVSNAVRYTAKGQVLIRGRPRGAWVWLQVWDSGSGIARQDRLRIFEEFVQVSSEKQGPAQTKGIGLGLSIVQRVAQRLDHRFVVRSRSGRGSLFAVRVPRVSEPPAIADAEASERWLEHHLAGQLILLIEDDAMARQSMLVLLQSFDCHVLEAHSSQTALAVVDGTLRTPDLILTDYRLSEHDTGLDAIAKVREAVGEPIPALLITAERQPPYAAAAQMGVPVLSKPLKPRGLSFALSDLLRKPLGASSDIDAGA